MKRRSIPARLVNFRVPSTILDVFDEKCFLSGKSRTVVLCTLIENHIKHKESCNKIGCPQDLSVCN